MQSVTKAELQANMMRIFREVEESGDELIVTENGRPVLAIRPLAGNRTAEEVFADLRGKIIFREDPDTPTSDDWEDL